MVFGIKGPKELLAEAIANALAEYFEVDPSKIESNLLVDAKIVLRNVRLRPQKSALQHQPGKDKEVVVFAATSGVVKEVAFTWAWVISNSGGGNSSGGSGGGGGNTTKDETGSWVKDATLTMRGLQFKTQLSYGIPGEDDTPATATATTATTTSKKKRPPPPAKSASLKKLETIKKEGKLEAYMRNQVEQIIDALTLRITDFEFTLALPPPPPGASDPSVASPVPAAAAGAAISVGGQTVELRSLGRLMDNNGALRQQLSFGSFYINILDNYHGLTPTVLDNTSTVVTYPLLSPLSYRAVATNRSKKRFSSVSSGLEVIGHPLASSSEGCDGKDEGVVFHAGSAQIKVLSQLGNILLASSSSSSEEEKEENADAAAPITANATNDNTNKGGDNIEHNEHDQLEALKQEILASSVFRFPISGISLVLPNGTKCTLESFTINYRADGTLMNLQGHCGAGILVDGFPLVATNSGENTVVADGDVSNTKSRWLVDFCACRFSIAGDGEPPSAGDPEETTSGTTTPNKVAFIKCRPEIIQKVMEGAMEIVESAGDLDVAVKESNPKSSSALSSPSSSSSSSWSVAIQNQVEFRLEKARAASAVDDDDDDDWMLLTIDSPSIKLPLGPSSEMQCGTMIIGPCSQGQLSVCVPPMRQLPGEESVLRLDGNIVIVVESASVAGDVREFLTGFAEGLAMPSGGSPSETAAADGGLGGLPFGIEIPRLNAALLSPVTQVSIEGIAAGTSSASAKAARFGGENGFRFEVSGIKAALSPELKVDIAEIESLRVPDVFSLSRPIQNTTLAFDKSGSLAVKLKVIDGILLDQPEGGSGREIEEGSSDDSDDGGTLPFPMSLSIEEMTLKKPTTTAASKKTKKESTKSTKESEKEQIILHLRRLKTSAKPAAAIEQGREKRNDGIPVTIQLGEVENKIVRLREMVASALIRPKSLGEIRCVKIAVAEPICIQAGHSTVEWSQMFRPRSKTPKAKSEPIQLPGVFIDDLELQISVDFTVVAQKDTKVELSAFRGSASTTSDDLIKHYSDRVLKRAPGMLLDTEVLGANVVDTTVATYGAFALHGGAYGGAAVGLISVVGVDGVIGALEAGKKSRGGKGDEGYQAGDFIRGLGFSIQTAAKTGGDKRRAKSGQSQSGDTDNLADFAVGMTSGAVDYADKNKARLGAAGMSGAGAIVGTILGGPVGGIIGGVLTGAVTGKTIEGLEKKYDKRSSASNTDEEELDKILEEESTEGSPAVPCPPTELVSDSVKEAMVLQKPQGLLYKRRDTFQTQWRPRLFVLHLDSCVLGYHFLIENEPAIVDTNKFNVFNKPALQSPASEDDAVGFEPVPRGIINLRGCHVKVNEKLTFRNKNLFAFTLTPPKGKDDNRPWNLAATTEEARFMWVGMLAEMTGQIRNAEALAQVCGVSEVPE